MASLIERLFGRHESSRTVARDRLKLVLMQDRATIPAPMLEEMRRELLAVLSKYVEIDESDLDLQMERDADAVALVANIPIRRVRTELPPAPKKEERRLR